MDYAAEQKTSGREPVYIIELDLDFCDLVHGVGACSSTETTGNECYNTLNTCHVTDDYDKTTKTIRLCSNIPGLPFTELDAFPCIESVNISPPTINPGNSLGVFGDVNITLSDFPHDDVGIDPYYANRSYTPFDIGTFFGKLHARNEFFTNRPMRVKVGYISQTGLDLVNDFRTYLFFIEELNPPNSRQKVTIKGKDIFRITEKTMFPEVTDSELATAATSTATTLNITRIDSLASSGRVQINDEIIIYTGKSGDTITGCTRGADGSTADEHDAGDSVQQCYHCSARPVEDVLEDLCLAAGIDSSYLPTTDWATYAATWFSGYNLTTTIGKPEKIKDLISELVRDTLIMPYWNPIDAEITLSGFVPPLTNLAESVNDTDNIIKGSMSVRRMTSEQITQKVIHFGLRDYSQKVEEENCSFHFISDDADAASADQYGSIKSDAIVSRWFTAANAPQALTTISRMRTQRTKPPLLVKFKIDAKDEDKVKTALGIELTARNIQGVTGAAEPTQMQVISSKHIERGDQFEITAISTGFNKRMAFIAPAGLSDYNLESETNRQKYAFISDASGKMSDGTDAYRII